MVEMTAKGGGVVATVGQNLVDWLVETRWREAGAHCDQPGDIPSGAQPTASDAVRMLRALPEEPTRAGESVMSGDVP